MPKNKELSIRMKLKDEATKRLKGIQGHFKRFSHAVKNHWMAITAAIIASIYVLKQLASTLMSVYKSVITTSSSVEQLRVRLKTLLGTAKEGNKVFEDMSELASNVPKTFDEIMESATDLAAVVRGGSEEIKKLMPIIVDISAGTGMGVREVTSQMIRMYSAGAASADMFRERGVLAALGFEAGVSYSAKQTMAVMTEMWETGVGKYVNAAEALKSTWKGMLSMMDDAWFQFKQAIGEDIFIAVKADLRAVLGLIMQSKEEGGKYEKVVKDVKKALVEGYEAAQDFMVTLIVGAGQAVDAWNELRFSLNSIILGWLKIQEFFKPAQVFTSWGEAGEKVKQQFEDLKGTIKELEKTQAELAASAQVDWSEKIAGAINKVKIAISGIKKELATVGGVEEEGDTPEIMKPTFIENVKQMWLDLGEGIKEGFEKAMKSFGSFKDRITKHTVLMINNMKTMWSDFVYNVFIGQLDDAKKAFESFGKSVLRIIANIISEWVTMQIITGIGKMFSAGAGAAAAGSVSPGMSTAGAEWGATSGFGGFHQGGMIRAHKGMYLAPDEVPIIAQTRERILNREDTVDLDKLLRRPEGGGEVHYHFDMTIVTNDEKSFRDRLLQNEDVYVNAGANSIERNGLLRGVINKYTKK